MEDEGAAKLDLVIQPECGFLPSVRLFLMIAECVRDHPHSCTSSLSPSRATNCGRRTEGRTDADGAAHGTGGGTGGRRTERIARSPSSERKEEDVDRPQSMAGSLGDHCLRRVIVAHPAQVEEKMAVIIEIQLAQMPT